AAVIDAVDVAPPTLRTSLMNVRIELKVHRLNQVVDHAYDVGDVSERLHESRHERPQRLAMPLTDPVVHGDRKLDECRHHVALRPVRPGALREVVRHLHEAAT